MHLVLDELRSTLMFSPYRTTTTELPALQLHPPHHLNPHSRCWCHPWPLSPPTKATLRWRMWVVVPGSPSPHPRWPHPKRLTTTASPGVSVTLYTTMATWSAVTSAGKMINDQEKLGYMHVTHVHVKKMLDCSCLLIGLFLSACLHLKRGVQGMWFRVSAFTGFI